MLYIKTDLLDEPSVLISWYVYVMINNLLCRQIAFNACLKNEEKFKKLRFPCAPQKNPVENLKLDRSAIVKHF